MYGIDAKTEKMKNEIEEKKSVYRKSARPRAENLKAVLKMGAWNVCRVDDGAVRCKSDQQNLGCDSNEPHANRRVLSC